MYASQPTSRGSEPFHVSGEEGLATMVGGLVGDLVTHTTLLHPTPLWVHDPRDLLVSRLIGPPLIPNTADRQPTENPAAEGRQSSERGESL